MSKPVFNVTIEIVYNGKVVTSHPTQVRVEAGSFFAVHDVFTWGPEIAPKNLPVQSFVRVTEPSSPLSVSLSPRRNLYAGERLEYRVAQDQHMFSSERQ